MTQQASVAPIAEVGRPAHEPSAPRATRDAFSRGTCPIAPRTEHASHVVDFTRIPRRCGHPGTAIIEQRGLVHQPASWSLAHTGRKDRQVRS